MKKIFSLALALVLCLAACLALADESVTFEPSWDVDMETYGDEGCSVKVSFTSEDVSDTNCLAYFVYDADHYSAEALKTLKVGDKIFANNAEVEVRTLEVEDDGAVYTINGGFGESADGVTLAYIDGDWDNLYSYQYNDFVSYTVLGQVYYPLADEVTIISYHWTEDGEPAEEYDEVKVPAAEVKAYLAKLETEQMIYFAPINTLLTLEGQKITDITVLWTPAA